MRKMRQHLSYSDGNHKTMRFGAGKPSVSLPELPDRYNHRSTFAGNQHSMYCEMNHQSHASWENIDAHAPAVGAGLLGRYLSQMARLDHPTDKQHRRQWSSTTPAPAASIIKLHTVSNRYQTIKVCSEYLQRITVEVFKVCERVARFTRSMRNSWDIDLQNSLKASAKADFQFQS